MALRLPNGRKHKPDAFVWMRQGPHEIREVKYESEASALEAWWEDIGRSVAALGYVYRVVTDLQLRHPPRKANVELFMRDRHAEVPDETVLEAMWSLLGSGPLAVADLIAEFPHLKRKQLHALVRVNFIAVTDLDQPFGEASLIVRRTRHVRRLAAAFRSDCRTGSSATFSQHT
jgi:hypothetical protein